MHRSQKKPIFADKNRDIIMQRILIVDDEDDICQILAYSLRNAGYEVVISHSAEEAIPQIELQMPSLVLLDIMMEGMSGTQFAAYLRNSGYEIPIIFLTALGSEKDVLQGFELGADDYITKPFRLTEVVARVGAVLKRIGAGREADSSPHHLKYQGIDINLQDKSLTVDNTSVNITRKELDLLCYLINHPGKLFSRAQLLDAVWHETTYVLERTVDVHITHLRHKLGPYREHLQTKSGFGYMWKP